MTNERFIRNYVPCVRCKREWREHVEGKCLFGATTFTPLSLENYDENLMADVVFYIDNVAWESERHREQAEEWTHSNCPHRHMDRNAWEDELHCMMCGLTQPIDSEERDT